MLTSNQSDDVDSNGIPTCFCLEYWKNHHPECPTRTTVERLRAEVERLQREVKRLTFMLRLSEGRSHPGYVIGVHWMSAAYHRICAGEAEDVVMRDYDWVRPADVAPEDKT